jgi:ABC-type multidrug transport system permease subunit
MTLPAPLAPGDTLRAEFDFDGKIHQSMDRSGYRKDHFDMAQWYPKLVVYDENIKLDGSGYLEFVIPGIIAMTAMNSSFNGSGTRLVVDQIHWRSFDESLMAPIGQPSLLLGKALIGVLRGAVSSIAFLIMAFVIWPELHIGLLFFFSLALICLVFSFLGVLSALLARSYDDMIMFTSIIITPMAFLGGTFFSLNYLPVALKYALYLLPLTHSSICLRASILGQPTPYISLVAIIGFLAVFNAGALFALKRKDA